jgi:hypothetical protein
MDDRFIFPSPRRASHTTDGSELGDEKPVGKCPTGMLSKLGIWLIFLVSLSLLLLAIAVTFVTWVWFGNREHELWRQLILGPNNALSITLTGVVVRFSVGSLAWATSAMMASVVVERYGVPADKIAHASIARYTGAILSLMFDGYALRKWFRLLIPLQLACAIASQFTSTLLFSDFGTAPRPGFPQETAVHYDFSPRPQDLNGDGDVPSTLSAMPQADANELVGWATSSTPASFETFAEYAEPERKINDERVDDTGPIWRAFLPIDSENLRTSISEYSGVARVFDARTMCVRPSIKEFWLKRNGAEDGPPARREGLEEGNFPIWYGVATIDAHLVPDLFDSHNQTLEVWFECPVISRPDFTRRNSYGVEIDPNAPPLPRIRTWEKCTTGVSEPNPDAPRPQLPTRMSTLDPIFYNMTGIYPLDANYFASTKNAKSDDPVAVYDNSPRIRIHDWRVGNSFILMDPGHPDRHLFPTGGDPFSALDLRLPIRSSKGNGPWIDFESFLRANQTLDLPDDKIARRKDVPIPIRATFCFDVMM